LTNRKYISLSHLLLIDSLIDEERAHTAAEFMSAIMVVINNNIDFLEAQKSVESALIPNRNKVLNSMSPLAASDLCITVFLNRRKELYDWKKTTSIKL